MLAGVALGDCGYNFPTYCNYSGSDNYANTATYRPNIQEILNIVRVTLIMEHAVTMSLQQHNTTISTLQSAH